MKLYDIDKKYNILSKEEAIDHILLLSKEFIEALKTVLFKINCDSTNIVGIGNSLAGGWSATDSDVRPFVLKLGNILKEELMKSGINVNFYNYALTSNNSNKEILKFILKNPSELDVKNRFINDKENWDKVFYNTPFRNYVSSEKAYSFYPESDHRFLDNYNNEALTITLLNGCTGGILNAASKEYPDKYMHFKKAYQTDLYYLKEIISYLTSLSEKNLITVGNFPYISTKIAGALTNRIIAKMNKPIEDTVKNFQCYYFDKNQLAFFQEFLNPETNKKELKLDNHPIIDEQYTVLYYYLEFLTNTLKENEIPTKKLLRIENKKTS